ncbi:MAG: response regulator transcription factor [Dehalococcoidia bacterium]|nr:response regulator transcription factor [Dehalococcoidia bacterium]
MKKYRVLVVDDEPRILNFLFTKLNARGFNVLTASSGLEAIEKVQSEEPDLIVLDIIMPHMSGFEALKEIRRFSSIPVIILSARDDAADKIRGLQLGADDYLPKPFNADELIARIEAIKRRLDSSKQRKIAEPASIGYLEIDFAGRSVSIDGKKLQLTRIEWLLLSELAQNAGHLMLHQDLLTHVWGPEYRDDVHLLRTWISRLRSKIEKDPKKPALIINIPKTGYIMEKPPSSIS